MNISEVVALIKALPDTAASNALAAALRAESAADLAENYGWSIENIAPNFDTSLPYSKGDYVSYEGTIYRFISDHSAGSWNTLHVIEVIIGDDIADLKSAIFQNKKLVFNENGSVSWVAI